jgi:succinate-semialdehyde dehydrogenase
MSPTDIASARSTNPATGEDLAAYPYLDADGVTAAVETSLRGFAAWRDTPTVERIVTLRQMAALLRRDGPTLAALITAEMGKPISQASAEVAKSVEALEWYADNGPSMLADAQTPIGPEAYVSYLPTGTILAVMPWNFPVWQVIRAAVPILLGGNSFLLKPAPNVVGCALELQRLWAEAGLARGAFTVVNCEPALVPAIIEHSSITGVTVTGGTAAGQSIAATAGSMLKKVVLELGGNDPFIVLADADIDRAAKTAARSRMLNAGQVCIAAKRIIVERAVYTEFTARLTRHIEDLVVGDPTNPETFVGPVAREDILVGIEDQVKRTLDAGATLMAGGHRLPGPGTFYAPTILADVTEDMAAFREEIFGPVAVVIPAQDAEDAIAKANDSEYGLSASLWTLDTARARTMARRIETGGVFINGPSASDPRIPMGGVKKSGFGRELSYLGVHEFANVQAVWDKTGNGHSLS